MYIRSAWPCSTTFVSPPAMVTPACRAACAIARTSASRTSVGNPASRMKVTTMDSGLAPDTARSLTVPLMASSPMEPPGKLNGFTTKQSVVMANWVPAISSVAESLKGSVEEPKRRGANKPSISRRLAIPPAPCAISICGSRKRTLAGAVPTVGSCFRLATPGWSPLPCGVRSCSKLRTIPPTTPSALPPDVQEYIPCQTTCTAPA